MSGYRRLTLVLMPAVLVLGLVGCRRRVAEELTLRIAVLPIIDALPLFVAHAEGFFTAEGVEVTLIPVGSAAERDQLLQAGQIDGVITDLVALMFYNRDETFMVAVRYAMVPTPEAPQFRILASSLSRASSPGDLRGVPVGISEGTIIEYVTYRLLEAAGLRQDEIATIAVPRIPERMALLEAGGLLAATLPEPLGSLALLQGATPIVDDSAYPDYSCSLYALRAEFVAAHPDVVAGLVRAIDRATAAINSDRERWAPLLSEQQLVPVPLLSAYTLPDYPEPGIVDAAQFHDVLSWLRESGRLSVPVAYEESVSDAFVQD
jgi:NitT/TauT family transport system substrate-binding protein